MHPSRIFKSEADLKKAWDEYKADLKRQGEEWQKVQYVGKEGERKIDNMKVPMTLEGFERYCFDNYGDVSNYFDNSQGYYEDFKAICSRIRKEIREQQIIGGLLGVYNPSITQRLNGLKEHTDLTSGGDKIQSEIDYSKLSTEALEQILNAKKQD